MFSCSLPKPVPVQLLGKNNDSPEPKLLKKGFAHSLIVFRHGAALEIPGQPPSIDDLGGLAFVTFVDGSAGLVPLNVLHWGVPQ